MPILNYTTTVSPETSIGQIAAMLVRKGANSITSEYKAGKVTGVSFVMSVGGLPVRYTLPANAAGVARVLMEANPWSSVRQGPKDAWAKKHRDRAEWVAWRILEDWVEAQVAMIESGQVEPAQIFLPYATQHDGRAFYQLLSRTTSGSLAREVRDGKVQLERQAGRSGDL